MFRTKNAKSCYRLLLLPSSILFTAVDVAVVTAVADARHSITFSVFGCAESPIETNENPFHILHNT